VPHETKHEAFDDQYVDDKVHVPLARLSQRVTAAKEPELGKCWCTVTVLGVSARPCVHGHVPGEGEFPKLVDYLWDTASLGDFNFYRNSKELVYHLALSHPGAPFITGKIGELNHIPNLNVVSQYADSNSLDLRAYIRHQPEAKPNLDSCLDTKL
jgi:hypothetical protein